MFHPLWHTGFWVGFVFGVLWLPIILTGMMSSSVDLFPELSDMSYRTSRGFLHLPQNSLTYFLALLTLSVLWGLVIGIVFQAIWRSQRWLKIITAVGLILSSLVSGMLLVAMDIETCISNQDNRNYCEKVDCQILTTELTGIKQITFRYLRGGTHNFLFTNNGGQTWQPFMSAGASIYAFSDCSHIDGLNESFFWTRFGDGFIFTHNGGQSWSVWTPRMLPGRFVYDEYSGYGEITNISFSDSNIGSMVLVDRCECDTKNVQTQLHTRDGGITWQTDILDNGDT